MQLWLLRHARAEAGAEGLADIDRRLSPEGRAEARRLGQELRPAGIPADCHVRVSPALRALETAAVVLADLGLYEPLVDRRIWEASTSDLLEVARDGFESSSRVLIVGHNPGLENLAHWLCGRLIPMSPGTLIRIDMRRGLQPGMGMLAGEPALPRAASSA